MSLTESKKADIHFEVQCQSAAHEYALNYFHAKEEFEERLQNAMNKYLDTVRAAAEKIRDSVRGEYHET